MYLRELRVVNDGPLSDVTVKLEATPKGPNPIVLVGENGSGKTNLLSIIADAIVEGAAQHHTDVVQKSGGPDRHWFRVVGGTTLRRGTSGGFSILRFEEGDATYVYTEKAGKFAVVSLPDDLSPELRAAANWDEDGHVKEFKIPEDEGRRIYGAGCYAYFPASRSEVPHWLNVESVPVTPFRTDPKYTGRLGKELFIEHAIDRLSEWIPRVILDGRPEVRSGGNLGSWQLVTQEFVRHGNTRDIYNRVLQIILDDDTASFFWDSRFGGLSFFSRRTNARLPLSTLSSGQATLLGIFGTVLQQCDMATRGDPLTAPGICLVDEIDAHVHIDLAYRAIPELIGLFPHIQFITSAHSPLYVLGMQARFRDEGMNLVDLPSGREISSEGYCEFANALAVLQRTKAFDDLVAGRLASQTGPLVLCEGETDPNYITTAATLLQREHILERLTLDWVGTRDSKSGGSIGAGKDNLRRVWQILTSNPGIATRPVLLIFDNDYAAGDEDFEGVWVRTIPTNSGNSVVRHGIENLLHESVFTEEMYSKTITDKGNGKRVEIVELQKTKLCDFLCCERRDPSDFDGFGVVLDILENWKGELGDVVIMENP